MNDLWFSRESQTSCSLLLQPAISSDSGVNIKYMYLLPLYIQDLEVQTRDTGLHLELVMSVHCERSLLVVKVKIKCEDYIHVCIFSTHCKY